MSAPITLPGLDLPPPAPTPARRIVKPKSARGRVKKGARVEREIAALHLALGIHAERVPLSGALASRLGPDYGGDLKIDLFPGCARATAEVKARAAGGGFITLEKWLGAHDLLFLKRNGVRPMVVLPWETWARLVGRGAA